MNIIDGLNQLVEEIQRRLEQIQEIKRLSELLPLHIQQSEGYVSVYSTGRLYVNLKGGDKKYAELFDLGFEFPPKPQFNEYNQEFSRETKTEVHDAANMVTTEAGVEIPKSIQVKITIDGIAKPPSCRVVEFEVLEVIKKFKAVCNEDGTKL